MPDTSTASPQRSAQRPCLEQGPPNPQRGRPGSGEPRAAQTTNPTPGPCRPVGRGPARGGSQGSPGRFGGGGGTGAGPRRLGADGGLSLQGSASGAPARPPAPPAAGGSAETETFRPQTWRLPEGGHRNARGCRGGPRVHCRLEGAGAHRAARDTPDTESPRGTLHPQVRPEWAHRDRRAALEPGTAGPKRVRHAAQLHQSAPSSSTTGGRDAQAAEPRLTGLVSPAGHQPAQPPPSEQPHGGRSSPPKQQGRCSLSGRPGSRV